MMENMIQTFVNREFGELEVLQDADKFFFPAIECAETLGYAKPRNAVARHCPHALKRGVVVKTGVKRDGSPALQTVEKIFIPEGDLYRLIIRSKLESAQRFEAWVFDEVLPTIRKHGAYVMPELLEELQRNTEKNAELLAILAKEQREKFALAFNDYLREQGIQYKVSGTWALYQCYADNGYTQTFTRIGRGNGVYVHMRWTQKGRLFLYNLLKSEGILPKIERAGA